MKLKEYQERTLKESESLPGAACRLAREGARRRGVAIRFCGEGVGEGRGRAHLPEEEGRAGAAAAGVLPQDSDRGRQDAAGGEDD